MSDRSPPFSVRLHGTCDNGEGPLTCCEHMALSQLPHEGRLRHNASHERSLFARASRCSYNHACKKGKEKNKYKKIKKTLKKRKWKRKVFLLTPVKTCMHTRMFFFFSSVKANISWFLDVTLDYVQRSQLFSLSLCFPDYPHFWQVADVV